MIIYCGSCTNARLQTLWRCSRPCRILKADRLSLIAPNIKRFFCVLVCFMGSAVYLAGRHVNSKIEPELKILRSEAHFLCLKQFNFYKFYCKYTQAPDILTCLPSNYRAVMQKKKSGLNSLQSPSNLAQRVFERCG